MKQKILVGFLAFHLFLIFLVNIYGTMDGYHGYYNGPTVRKSGFHRFTEEIVFSPPIWTYASLSGTNAGYGYYSPNVASQFVMEFTIYDSTGQELAKKSAPTFSNRESLHRFTLCTSMMQEKLASNRTNDVLNDYLEVVFAQASRWVMREYPSSAYVKTSIQLYDHPDIDDYLKGLKPQLIEVDTFNFTMN